MIGLSCMIGLNCMITWDGGVDDAQAPGAHLEPGAGGTADRVEPPLPGGGVQDPVGVPEFVRGTVPAVRERRPAQQ